MTSRKFDPLCHAEMPKLPKVLIPLSAWVIILYVPYVAFPRILLSWNYMNNWHVEYFNIKIIKVCQEFDQ